MQLGYVLVDVGVGSGRGKMRRKRSTARLSSSILTSLSGAPPRETALVDELGQRAENGLDDRLAPVRGPRSISKRPSETSARKRSPPSQGS
jgi:hypothetical protein